MRFGVLGPVAVWDGDRQLAVGGPQQRALLAALLLNANRVVSTDRLVDYLWSEQPPPTARGLLQGCVAGLRRVLQTANPPAKDRLRTVAPGYLLRVEPGELDLDRFEELARLSHTEADPERAAGYLSEALSLWCGPALDGVTAAGYGPDVARLEERRLTVLEQRIDLDLRLGRHAELVGELQRLVAAHQLRERSWAQLMLALHRADRRADALDAYQQLRRTLVAQLGVEPSATVRQLHRAILAGGDGCADYPPAARRPAGGRTEVTPVPREWTVPAQLPAAPAQFTGRSRHLKRLDELLSDSEDGLRVAVISGMAGVGKTSLAVLWAHRARPRFGDGQLYVNLRGHGPSPPMRPIEALAGFLQGLGVPAKRMPADLNQAAALYRSLLADRRVLVLLDNASSIEQVRPLLPGGAGCLVLVTSRERLAGLVATEGAAHLSLDVLEPAEARDLLARVLGQERVQSEPESAAELGRLCAYLPLALRLAAANLAIHPGLPIAELVAQLVADDRLAALALDRDEASAVRAAFDHSYVAMPADARRLFRLLGLVPGPHISAAAAAALADAEPEPAAQLLGRLARAHLLEQPASGRYALHDLVRLYAADRSREEDTVDGRLAALDRLFRWYLQTADAAADLLYPEVLRLTRPDPPDPGVSFDSHRQALAWLDTERPNLVAAVEHAGASGTHRAAYHLADALQGFYSLRMHPVEWLTISHAGLAAARAEPDQRAETAAELGLGNVYLRLSQHERAIQHFSRTLELGQRIGWAEIQCRACNGLGVVFLRQWRPAEAIDNFERALRHARTAGWVAGEAAGLVNLALATGGLGNLRQATGHLIEALRLFRQLGAHGKAAQCLAILGINCYLLGQLGQAADYSQQALALARAAGDRSTEAKTLVVVATVHCDTGRYEQASEAAQLGLAGAREIGDYGIEPSGLVALGWIHYHLGRYQQAETNLLRARQLARDSEDRMHEAQALNALVAVQLRLDRVDDARSAGERALALASGGRDRLEQGRALTALAAVDLAEDRLDEAIARAGQAIEIHQETGHRLGEARARRELADALSRRGDTAAGAASRRLAYEILAEIGSPEASSLKSPHVSSRDR